MSILSLIDKMKEPLVNGSEEFSVIVEIILKTTVHYPMIFKRNNLCLWFAKLRA